MFLIQRKYRPLLGLDITTSSVKLIELAMAGGQVEAFQWRGVIMQSMTEAERDEAWRLLARWRETHRK